jgi:23S rRNA pseudouridine1911/1915/1917 synthase
MVVTLAAAPVDPSPARAEAIDMVVLYEDEDVAAIDKPPGMVVHPAPGARAGTVVNAILHRWGALPGFADAARPGIVHRLDKDTSGVLLVAKSMGALDGLARQFRDRTIAKRYVALVHGTVRCAEGRIDRPIGRDPKERKRMSVRSRRSRTAVTGYRVLEQFPGAALVTLEPETGRTHQLRVHLASIGHPIVGDAVYGGRRRGAVAGSAPVLARCPRQALHAATISFVHPRSEKRITVESPLPSDLTTIVDELRNLARTQHNRGDSA